MVWQKRTKRGKEETAVVIIVHIAAKHALILMLLNALNTRNNRNRVDEPLISITQNKTRLHVGSGKHTHSCSYSLLLLFKPLYYIRSTFPWECNNYSWFWSSCSRFVCACARASTRCTFRRETNRTGSMEKDFIHTQHTTPTYSHMRKFFLEIKMWSLFFFKQTF